jgi:hypothetical protein
MIEPPNFMRQKVCYRMIRSGGDDFMFQLIDKLSGDDVQVMKEWKAVVNPFDSFTVGPFELVMKNQITALLLPNWWFY